MFLALATCYCNDIYPEADKRGNKIERVEVEVKGESGAVGEAQIRELMSHTDRLAEIQNTLRLRMRVSLSDMEALTV